LVWFIFTCENPPATIAAWRSAMVKAANLPEVQERFVKAGGHPISPSAEEVKAIIAKDYVRWKNLISDANVKAD
jgi:tripartite-type tricarboxylate transporter receptor subunit TctC